MQCFEDLRIVASFQSTSISATCTSESIAGSDLRIKRHRRSPTCSSILLLYTISLELFSSGISKLHHTLYKRNPSINLTPASFRLDMPRRLSYQSHAPTELTAPGCRIYHINQTEEIETEAHQKQSNSC